MDVFYVRLCHGHCPLQARLRIDSIQAPINCRHDQCCANVSKFEDPHHLRCFQSETVTKTPSRSMLRFRNTWRFRVALARTLLVKISAKLLFSRVFGPHSQQPAISSCVLLHSRRNRTIFIYSFRSSLESLAVCKTSHPGIRGLLVQNTNVENQRARELYLLGMWAIMRPQFVLLAERRLLQSRLEHRLIDRLTDRFSENDEWEGK